MGKVLVLNAKLGKFLKWLLNTETITPWLIEQINDIYFLNILIVFFLILLPTIDDKVKKN